MALGSDWEVPGDIFPNVEKFVCTLYGRKDSAGVNAAIYNLFRLTCISEALPPYQNCLKHHFAIHRRCLDRFIDAQWVMDDKWKMDHWSTNGCKIILHHNLC